VSTTTFIAGVGTGSLPIVCFKLLGFCRKAAAAGSPRKAVSPAPMPLSSAKTKYFQRTKALINHA